jgi:hypothetical protein
VNQDLQRMRAIDGTARRITVKRRRKFEDHEAAYLGYQISLDEICPSNSRDRLSALSVVPVKVTKLF